MGDSSLEKDLENPVIIAHSYTSVRTGFDQNMLIMCNNDW
jgi:hypothetical protein